MMIHGMIRLFSVLAIVTASTSYASSYETRPISAQTTNAVRDLIDAYKQGDMHFGVKIAAGMMVRRGAQLLASRGFRADAEKSVHDWNNLSTGIGALDVGDFTPMSTWLANYYEVLAQRFGEGILKQLHLDDILMLNYAIPVVFHPRGNSKHHEKYDIKEYRMHFVPFSGAITYWLSWGVCTYAAAQTGIKAIQGQCGNIASLLRKGMVMYPAPKLADWIYKQTNRKGLMMMEEMILTDRDLRFLDRTENRFQF